MKLRNEYESVHSNLLSRDPRPSLNTCLGELLCEEQRHLTQAMLEQKNQVVDAAYASQTKLRDLSKLQCYSCKEFGHMANQCKQKFCNEPMIVKGQDTSFLNVASGPKIEDIVIFIQTS